LLVGGDYNIMRNSSEKNSDRYHARWLFLFNVVIDGLNLKEIELPGRKYTWTSNLANPTFKKLDRVLVTIEWEEKYTLTTVQALTRGVSDHTPLLLNTEESSLAAAQPMFKFELGCLLRYGFMEMVKDIWDHIVEGHTPIERWKGKIRWLRQYL
jgi:hypothetical protein